MRVVFVTNYLTTINQPYRKLCELHKDIPIDILLTMSNPIESHIAGQRFKQDQPMVKWITYFGDLFPRKENKTNLLISLEKMSAIEASIVQSADHILVTDELFSHFNSNYQISDKLTSLPYTLKTDILELPIKPVRKVGRVFVCMGSVNKKSRNPGFMLQVLSKVLAPDDRLHLFVQGDCNKIIDRFVSSSAGRILAHGIVPQQQLVDAMCSADYLVNIGNAIKTSTPSKVYELISYRKPVIDFYYQGFEEDAWNGYPEYCRVMIGSELSESIKKLNAFLDRQHEVINIATMKSTYSRHLPEHSEQIMLYAFGLTKAT